MERIVYLKKRDYLKPYEIVFVFSFTIVLMKKMQSFRVATNTKLLNFLNEIFNNPFLELKSYIPNQVTLVTIMKYEFITSAVKEFPVQSFIYSSTLLRKLLFQIQSRDP